MTRRILLPALLVALCAQSRAQWLNLDPPAPPVAAVSKMYSSPSTSRKSTPNSVFRSFMWWPSSIMNATPLVPSLALTNGLFQFLGFASWSAIGRVS